MASQQKCMIEGLQQKFKGYDPAKVHGIWPHSKSAMGYGLPTKIHGVWPNTPWDIVQQKSTTTEKHIKGSKECYLLGQNTKRKFLGNPLYQANKTTLKQQLNGEKLMKNEMES